MKYKHNINLIYIIVSFAILATAFIIFEVNSNRVNERNLVGGATTTTLEHPIATSSNTDKELGKSSSYEQLSQEFKITASTPTYSLTGAKVYLMRYNSPTYPITVSIRSSLSGSNIVSTTITPTGLSTSSPTLVKVNFGSNTLKSGNTYYLTLSVSSTDIHNYYKWTLSSANPYEDGYFYRETTRYSSYDAYATILYTLSSPPPPPPSTCSDGTAINQCSSTKPLYCNSALQLVNNCGSCGCSAGYTCQSDGACIITPI
ncbi:hypothetical protein HYW99_03045, partial [Candidatus Woesearchaeota archaeon]|nr:hypothetical protein [Candidatus Woesearchaeota archaeon]